MYNIAVEALPNVPIEDQRVELVERKGTGHPDTICDGIMDRVSVGLCREYLSTFGRLLHHNIDKGLLVAGRSEPRPGGGNLLEPMRLVFGDRATAKYKGKEIDVAGIAEESAKSWLREHLRFVDAERHMLFQNELKEGSVELTDLFEREVMGANDTSAAVGYAPLSRTEQAVLAAERCLNSEEFKEAFPETGEDVKVMGYRNGGRLTLVVGLAFVDRFIPDADSYFERKRRVVAALEKHLRDQPWSFEEMEIVVNALDDPQRGAGGMYLTVLGTSAEGGDSGQVGRGNRVNGVIALNRPMSAEAAAGKNPVSHVGKIYSALTHHIAGEIYKEVPGLREVYVRFCSRIGAPIDEPIIASAQLVPEPGVGLEDIEKAVRSVMERALGNINDFTMRLARGELLLW